MKNYSIPFVGDVTDLEIGLDISLPMSGTLIQFPASGSSPSLTGPSSITEGGSEQATGTNLDTVLTFTLQAGSHTLAQTIDAQTATTLDYTAESGLNDSVIGTPATGIPLTPSITAAGFTGYTIQQHADDGTNQDTSNVTMAPESGFICIQVMIATSNLIDGESAVGPSIIAVEDDMQLVVPLSAGLSTYTWNADLTFESDVDETNIVTVYYFSPATGQWSGHNLTISQSEIVTTTPDLSISVTGLIIPILSVSGTIDDDPVSVIGLID